MSAGKCETCDGAGKLCPAHTGCDSPLFPEFDPDNCHGCGCPAVDHRRCLDCNGSGLDGNGVTLTGG